MKKFLVAIMAVLFAAPSFAQYSSGGFSLSESSVYYGIRLGMNIATLTGDATDAGSKVGLNFGGTIGLRLSDTTPLFLESGLYYTGCGAKKDKNSVSLNYLELPLLIKYGVKATEDIAILPFVGPYFARAGWGKTKQYTMEGETVSKKVEKVGTFDEKKAATGGLNRLNMGFKLGCAAEYNKLYVEIGYQIGVSNIAKDDNKTIHSNAFFANFGVNF